jgi:hypothetical protein
VCLARAAAAALLLSPCRSAPPLSPFFLLAVAQPAASKTVQQMQPQMMTPWQWDSPMSSAPFFGRELAPFGGAFGGGFGLSPFGGLMGPRGVFEELANLPSKVAATMPQPIAVDIVESPAQYEVKANVPGYQKAREGEGGACLVAMHACRRTKRAPTRIHLPFSRRTSSR